MGMLRCKCTFRYLLARKLKLLAKRHDMFGNSEQPDCYEAFQAIYDILDKATLITYIALKLRTILLVLFLQKLYVIIGRLFL